MRRTDLEGVDLDDYLKRLAVHRVMTPEAKRQEIDRLWTEARARESAFRASLFDLGDDRSPRCGRVVRVAADDPRGANGTGPP